MQTFLSHHISSAWAYQACEEHKTVDPLIVKLYIWPCITQWTRHPVIKMFSITHQPSHSVVHWPIFSQFAEREKYIKQSILLAHYYRWDSGLKPPAALLAGQASTHDSLLIYLTHPPTHQTDLGGKKSKVYSTVSLNNYLQQLLSRN